MASNSRRNRQFYTFSTSAKSNEGINESFNYLANANYDKICFKKEIEEKYSEENQKKELKILKVELNQNKNEYDKLKKDYDTLKKNMIN